MLLPLSDIGVDVRSPAGGRGPRHRAGRSPATRLGLGVPGGLLLQRLSGPTKRGGRPARHGDRRRARRPPAASDVPLLSRPGLRVRLPFSRVDRGCSSGTSTGSGRERLRALRRARPPGGVLAQLPDASARRGRASFEEGVAQRRRGRSPVRIDRPPFALASALEGLGYVYLRKGEIAQAIGLLERGLQICEQRQLHLVGYMVQAYLGYAYALAGRDAEAMPLLAESALIDWGLHPALRVTMQGEAHLLAGRRDQARQCVDRGLALAAVGEEHGSRAGPFGSPRKSRGAGTGERRPGRCTLPGGAGHRRGAGMRPLQAHCHLGLGKLYRAWAGRGSAPSYRRRSRCSARWGWRSGCRRPRPRSPQAVAAVSGELAH